MSDEAIRSLKLKLLIFVNTVF